MRIFILCVFALLFSSPTFAAQMLTFSDLKLLSADTTAQDVFADAINLAPNFGINDSDEGLKPYFNPANGESNLCAPTALADFLVYQMAITHLLPITAAVPGISADLKSIDANALVIDLYHRCKTDPATGTLGPDLMNCMGDAIKAYYGKSITIDHIFKYDANTDFHFPTYVKWINKDPDFTDITAAIRNGDPVLTQIDWWSSAPDHSNPHRVGGHYFPIFGYARQDYFQDNLLQLDITDTSPISPWSVNQLNSDYNSVTALRNNNNSYIFLDGRGFNGQTVRGFIGQLTIIHIQ